MFTELGAFVKAGIIFVGFGFFAEVGGFRAGDWVLVEDVIGVAGPGPGPGVLKKLIILHLDFRRGAVLVGVAAAGVGDNGFAPLEGSAIGFAPLEGGAVEFAPLEGGAVGRFVGALDFGEALASTGPGRWLFEAGAEDPLPVMDELGGAFISTLSSVLLFGGAVGRLVGMFEVKDSDSGFLGAWLIAPDGPGRFVGGIVEVGLASDIPSGLLCSAVFSFVASTIAAVVGFCRAFEV